MKKKEKIELDKFVDDLQAQIWAEESTIFSDKVIEEYKNPKNIGRLKDADGEAKIKGYCGDSMEIYLKVTGNKISQISFMTDGCGATLACGSKLTSMVKDRTLDYAKMFTESQLIKALDGLPEENEHCAKLTVKTLHEAIRNIKRNEV